MEWPPSIPLCLVVHTMRITLGKRIQNEHPYPSQPKTNSHHYLVQRGVRSNNSPYSPTTIIMLYRNHTHYALWFSWRRSHPKNLPYRIQPHSLAYWGRSRRSWCIANTQWTPWLQHQGPNWTRSSVSLVGHCCSGSRNTRVLKSRHLRTYPLPMPTLCTTYGPLGFLLGQLWVYLAPIGY